MSDSQHTPGPWHITPSLEDRLRPKHYVEKAVDYHQPDGKHVTAHCLADVFDTDEGEGLANARLIAAAPDLLAVVDELLATATVETPPKLIEMAGKALRKATGTESHEPT